MKRQLQLEESVEGGDNGRRTKARYEDENIAAVNLDLNATPRGFDLNAPVIEEPDSPGQPSWRPGEEPVKEMSVMQKINLQSTNLISATDAMNSMPEGEEYEGTEEITAEALAGSETLEAEVEACQGSQVGSPEQHSHSMAAAIFHRSLEPAASLGINEDLDILWSVWYAYNHGDVESLDNILAETCEDLAKSPFSPSKYHYLSCIYVSKKLPEAFSLPKTFKVLTSFFGTTNSQPAGKRQIILPILASKLLVRAFEAESQWPLEFIKVYLEDAIGPRSWVDHEGCKELIMNVSTAFSDAYLEASTGGDCYSGSRSDSTGYQEGQLSKRESGLVNSHDTIVAKNRYPTDEVRRMVREEFLQALHQLLGVASTKENPRQLLKLLMQGVGYEEVRVLASSMLESWLNNPVHLRAGKALLDQILEKTHGVSENDLHTVANLLSLRVTSLQGPGQIKSLHGNIYADMVTQLVRRRSEYASLALKTFVMAEMNGKNLFNLKSIATILKAMPESPPPEHELALVLQEQAVNEECRPQLKEFARRLMKHVGQELNVHVLCRGLLQPWPAMAEQDETLKEGWLTHVVELTCQLLLHAIAFFAGDENFVQAVTGTASSTTSGSDSSATVAASKEKFAMLEKFSLDMGTFQTEAMAWCTDVLAGYLPSLVAARFKSILQQFLFLEDSQVYIPKEESNNEVGMASFQLLSTCTRASEEILARVILIGISSEFPLTQREALEIIESLVWRAAALQKHMSGALQAESTQLPGAIFKLASLSLPGVGRQLSHLVSKDMYWRACLVVLLVAVNNANKIGKYAWENFPTIRSMMEALITCSRTFLPFSDDEAVRLEADRQEIEALQRDAKAEEAISAFILEKRRAESGVDDADNRDLPDLPTATSSQDKEWKGNVMFLNHSGAARRPPGSVIQELDRAEEQYRLGQLLRKSRDPDYFVEITTSQRLQQAWLWLRMVLAGEPELVTRLPLLWQCELLYIYKGLPLANQKHAIDLSFVCSSLHKAIIQESPSKDGNIREIMGFLSQKLASKKSAVRSQARHCFSGILDPSFFSLSKETYSSKKYKGMPLHGTSGATDFCDGNFKRVDLGWLEVLDQLPAGSRLVDALHSTIRTAVQQETSIEVVILYLNFLRKHSPPPPSSLSVACCIAALAVQRKMLTAALFKSQKSFTSIPSLSAEGYPSVINLFLDSLKDALEVGILPVSNQETSTTPNVILASPHFDNEKKVILSHVSLQKFVVDAAIEVLLLLACEASDTAGSNSTYERLLEILFPGFTVLEQECTMQLHMAWLESYPGSQLPLLSENQALALARSKDARLAKAGLSVLHPRAKIQLCAELGLSATAAAALLEELDCVADARLEIFPKAGSFLTKKAEKLKGSVTILAKLGSQKGSNFLGLMARSAPEYSSVTELLPITFPEWRDEEVLTLLADANLVEQSHRKFSIEDIVQHVFQPSLMDLPSSFLSKYIYFRKLLQEVNCYGFESSVLKQLSMAVQALENVEGQGLPPSLVMTLYIPLLASIGGFKPFLWKLFKMNSQCSSLLIFQPALKFIFHHIRSWLTGSSDTVKQGVSEKMSPIFVQAKIIVEELENFLLGSLPITELNHETSITCLQRNSHVQKEDISMDILDLLQLHEVEFAIRKLLAVRLNRARCRNEGIEKSEVQSLAEELVGFLKKWMNKGKDNFTGIVDDSIETQAFNKDIALVGGSGLVMGFLKFLNPEMTLQQYIVQLFEVPHMPTGQFLTQDLYLHCLPTLLGWVVHQSSWHFTTSIFQRLLRESVELLSQNKNVSFPLRSDVSKENFSCSANRITLSRQMLAHAGALIEFTCIVFSHPRVILAGRSLDPHNLSESSINIMASLLTPGAARAVCLLAVIVFAASTVVPRNFMIHRSSEVSWATLSHGDICSLEACIDHKYEKLVLKALLLVVCQGGDTMRLVLQQLYTWEQGVNRNILNGIFLGETVLIETAKDTAKELLWRLYFTFPVAAESIFQSEVNIYSSIDGPSSDFLFSRGKAFTYGQTCSMGSIIHRMLLLAFDGIGNDVAATYGFCQNLARQHPTLFIPHIPFLTMLLKELLLVLKRGDTEEYNHVAHSLSMGVGILDALRPLILELTNSNQAAFYLSHKLFEENKRDLPPVDGLESLLHVYIQFLQSIQTQDAPQFGKVVARLTDFLCHCVASGGNCRELVAAHRYGVLQSAAEKFSKIKKLSFLLSLIDNSSTGENAMNADGGSLTMTPPLPFDDVQKVQKQLQRFIGMQKVGLKRDQVSSTRWRLLRECQHQTEAMDDEALEDLDLAASIADLDKASARMPAILPILEDTLVQLTQVQDVCISNQIFNLLERLLTECPSKDSARKIGENLLLQLTSSNATLAKTAARQASRFFCFCSGLQEVMLLELFQMSQCAPDYLQQLLLLLFSFSRSSEPTIDTHG